MLRRSPVFFVASVVSLALGIGAAVAVVTVAHQLLWDPLPYPSEERLAFMNEVEPSGTATGVALANILDFRDAVSALGSLGLLTVVAILASTLPSRAAVHTSPLELLRED